MKTHHRLRSALSFMALFLISMLDHSPIFAQEGNVFTGVTFEEVREEGEDYLEFVPLCNGPCPEGILDRYHFEWNFGDCTYEYGKRVRRQYREPFDGLVTLKAKAIYDNDDDEETDAPFQINPQPGSGGPFIKAKLDFDIPPRPGFSFGIAITLDHSFIGGLENTTLTLIPDGKLATGWAWHDTVPDCHPNNNLEEQGDQNELSRVMTIEGNLQENSPFTFWSGFDTPEELNTEDSVVFLAIFKGQDASGDWKVDTARIVRGVVSSYDPNYVSAMPKVFFEPGDRIWYTIHFQNEGNFPTDTVTIIDELNKAFDLQTIEWSPDSASHPGFSILVKNRSLIFINDSLQLAPQSEDEMASKGYVSFSIQVRSDTDSVRHVVNDAEIYFDFNDRIRTDPVVHSLRCPLLPENCSGAGGGFVFLGICWCDKPSFYYCLVIILVLLLVSVVCLITCFKKKNPPPFIQPRTGLPLEETADFAALVKERNDLAATCNNLQKQVEGLSKQLGQCEDQRAQLREELQDLQDPDKGGGAGFSTQDS